VLTLQYKKSNLSSYENCKNNKKKIITKKRERDIKNYKELKVSKIKSNLKYCF